MRVLFTLRRARLWAVAFGRHGYQSAVQILLVRIKLWDIVLELG